MSDEEPRTSIADEMMVGAAGADTLHRFLELRKIGYEPDYVISSRNGLWMMHPNRKFPERSLILFGSGVLKSSRRTHSKEGIEIDRWEHDRFEQFLRSVPPPGWWEKEYRPALNALLVAIVASMVALVYLSGKLFH